MQSETVFSVDGLSITVFHRFDIARTIAAEMGFAELERSSHGTKGYAQQHTGVHGFRIGSLPGGDDKYCTLFLLGDALAYAGIDKVMEAVKNAVLQGSRIQVSRVDLALDTQKMTTDMVLKARNQNKLSTRSECFREWTSEKDRVRTGHSLYFGSRESDAMLRVYYKTDGKSFGENVPFTRLEMEYKGKRADMVFQRLFASEMSTWAEQAQAWLSAYIQIDARWWRKWLDGIKASWLLIERKMPTVEKTRAWIERQVSSALAAYVYAIADKSVPMAINEFWRLFYVGWSKIGREQLQMIDAYREQKDTRYAVFA